MKRIKSEIFRALRENRHRVQLDAKTKRRNRKSKLARKEMDRQLKGD